MRASEFIVEYKKQSLEDYEGLKFRMVGADGQLFVNVFEPTGSMELGHVTFDIGDNNELDPQELFVKEKYRSQGIASMMYDFVKSKGYTIVRSYDQTDAGAGFWDKHRGEDVRIWEDEHIEEGATSVLYHYTSGRPALKILQTGEFELTSSYGNKSEEKITPPGYPYYMSTTRSKVGDYHVRYPGSHAVMFVLDGNKIAQRYKVKPVDYWERMWASDESNQRTRESEDRVYSKTPTIPADSIKEIHQLVMGKDEHRGPVIRNMAILAKKRGIPIFFYTDEDSWVLQDKRKAVPVSQIASELGGQMPNAYHRPSRRISSLEQWLELIMKSDQSQLSDEANKLRYNLVYYGSRHSEDDQSLRNDLHNARKPGETDRPYAIKLIDYMRKNGMSTIDLKNAMVAKWSPKIDK